MDMPFRSIGCRHFSIFRYQVIAQPIVDSLLSNGWTVALVWNLLTFFAVSPERGAQTSAYLACSPEVEAISGKYFSRSQVNPSSRLSYDRVAAKRLWDVSVSLTGLEEIALPASA